MCNVLGFTFIHLAIDTGKEIDLIFAWNLSQTLVVLVAESVLMWSIPDWVQLAGFAVGILGSLTLIVPDLMSRLWYTVTGQSGQEINEVDNLEALDKSDDSLEMNRRQKKSTLAESDHKKPEFQNKSFFSDD